MKHLLSLDDLSFDAITGLLDLADRFRADGIPAARPGATVAGLFFNPSLRTRTSLELATTALGGHCIVHDVGGGVWKLETRDGAVMDGDKAEHVRDALGFLSAAVDCIGVRCFADPARPYEEQREDPVLHAIAAASSAPVVNLESACRHPMQGLADLMTARARLPGPPEERTVAVTWAYHPRPLPMSVAQTALVAFARAGYRVRLVHPEGFDLDADAVRRAQEHAPGRFSIHHDLDDGLAGADVCYAKSWGARTEVGPGAASLRDDLDDWIIDARRQALGRPAAFMHCLPVRRNVVVADEVIDGPHSWVREQAHNRVFTQAAVLHELL